MCDPRWCYGLPISLDLLYNFAVEKAPDCLDDDDESSSAIQVVEKFQRMIKQPLDLEICYDVFDENLKSTLILVFHQNYFGFSKIRLEDEVLLRETLGVKEKGKWYRYIGAFSLKRLEDYKKRAIELGPIPSRNSVAGKSSDIKQSTGVVSTVSE